MHSLYNLVSGPLVWIAFILFIGGSLYRLITMAALAKEKDPVIYEYMDFRYALRSIFHWIIPFRSVNMRLKPVTTVISFLFHICIVILPIFLSAHVILWKETWNISWFYISDPVADVMTVIVIGACVFFLVRRLKLPQVRYLTTPSDFLILAIVAAPFVTGFWAYHQFPGYQWMTIFHMLSGEIMLVAIPFTRLSHMLFFPFTRGYTGSEFGKVKNAVDW